MWSSTRSTRSCAVTAAGRRSALSSVFRAWRACGPAALAFRPPSGTRNARASFSHRGRDATASFPALRSRAACGASPWSTSTTRVPKRNSVDLRAWVLKRPKCLRASASRQRCPRHCPSAPKTCAIAGNSHRRNGANVASRHGQGCPQGPSHFLGPRGRSRHPAGNRTGAAQPHRHRTRQRRPRHGLHL